jgi:hypothetical protein
MPAIAEKERSGPSSGPRGWGPRGVRLRAGLRFGCARACLDMGLLAGQPLKLEEQGGQGAARLGDAGIARREDLEQAD